MAGVLVLHDAPLMADGKMAVHLGGEYQSNNKLLDYTVNFAGRQKAFVWNWRWSQKDAGEYRNKVDGRVPGSQFKERAVKGMMGVNQDWGHSHLKLSYYYIRPGMIEGGRHVETNELEPSDAFQRIQHYKALLDNSFNIGEGSLKVLVGYQQNRRQEYENAETPGLDFRLHTMNYDVHYLLAHQEAWQFAGGVSGMWQRSQNLGTEYLIPAYRLFDIGAFASVTHHIESLTLSGGLRFDNRSLHSYALEDKGELRFMDFYRSFRGLTGSLGAIYNITERLDVRLNVSHGFRAPNLSELGSNGEHEGTFRFEHGNQDLKAEQSWQLDLGMDFSSEFVTAQLSLFANHISNYIFLERESPLTNDYRYQQGTARLLLRKQQEYGFQAEICPAILEGGKPISSTRIRALIAAGDIYQASEFLGYSLTIMGRVVHGDRRGRKLGFPTANIALTETQATLPNGVYAAEVLYAGQRYNALANIGDNPTFTGCNRRLEVNIRAFDDDIYDRMLEVRFLGQLREELKFASADELVAQMHRDLERAALYWRN